MSERIIDVSFGPYSLPTGEWYIKALVRDSSGAVYEEEIFYEDQEDMYDDLEDFMNYGFTELSEEDDVEEYEDDI